MNKEKKGYDLGTREFLSLSLFCNASKTTYLMLQRYIIANEKHSKKKKIIIVQ